MIASLTVEWMSPPNRKAKTAIKVTTVTTTPPVFIAPQAPRRLGLSALPLLAPSVLGLFVLFAKTNKMKTQASAHFVLLRLWSKH